MPDILNSTIEPEKFMFQFEAEFDYRASRQWMKQNWTLAFYLAGAYIFLIFGIQNWMKTRQRFNLRRTLMVWNSLLAVFSIFGTIRFLPLFWTLLSQPNGFHKSVCSPLMLNEHHPMVAFWSSIFAFSKALELVDTIFIVLRKQPLIFLHYYHHVTVLVFTWYSYGQYISSSSWYIAINLFIHSLMYSYYVLKAIKFKIPKPIAIAITSLQIVQMFIGVIVNVYAYRTKTAGTECDIPFDNIFWSAAMYGSYFYLFVDFFRKAYFCKVKTGLGNSGSQKRAPSSTTLVDNVNSPNNIIITGKESVKLVWRNIFIFIYLHGAALYGIYLWLSGQVMWQTFLWAFAFYCMCGFGITGGAHRYWAHKSFKANTPLRLILAYMQTVACQNSIYEWCRDHRVHHKYTETNADPHDARRGFFFSHMGWLMCRKHKDVKEKGKCIDMSDLDADAIVMFQKKYYTSLVLSISFIIPTIIPWIFWGENLATAWFFAAQFRYCITLHMTWLVNSAAHLWGHRPYDKTINPSENKSVAFLAFGEGWHNYHHVFPWDYKTAEIGHYRFNFTAAFIDLFAWMGWAYDLKTVPEEVVLQRVSRTGDGSHGCNVNKFDNKLEHFEPGPWGWGDKEIPADHVATTKILCTKKEE